MGKLILVVEDDDATRGLIDVVLRESGYAVLQARDGVEALEAVRREPPDLIVLDKQMPRMDGTEFAKSYRKRRGDHAPIVALCAAIDCPEWARSIGAAASLMKPFAIEELAALVARIVAATSTATRQTARR